MKARALVLALLGSLALGVGAPRPAAAQAPARGAARPELRLTADAPAVGVGDVLQLTLSAMTTNGGDVADPEPGAIKGFALAGRSVSPSTSISIVNGVMTNRRGLTVTWMLKATAVGTYSLGPATVTLDGQKFASSAVSVQVVPAGQAPQRPRNNPFGPGFSPFDPWKDLFNFPGDDPGARGFVDPVSPPIDPRFNLEAPLGAQAFLHAVVDKRKAVVGEQVTYTVYLYVDPQSSSPKWGDEHDTSTPDFLKYPLFKDDDILKSVGFGNVGGQPWRVFLFRKYALFPLKAGELPIGPMALTLGGRRTNGVRESENVIVRVSEPPIAGRPPGYAVGDVGQIKMSVAVDPREVPQGGAVGVTLTVSGTGNLPSNLLPPTRPGAEWMTPETRDKLGPMAGDRYGGERILSYVVRLTKPGAIDLGAFVLPYWDPAQRAYNVAKAELGTITVGPAPGATLSGSALAGAPSSETVTELLAGLPAARGRREGAPPPVLTVAERPVFWGSLALPSFAWFGFALSRSLRQRVRKARAEHSASPERELKERMAAASAACAGSDPKLADAAIARALEASTVAHLSLNVRGIPADQVAQALEERAVKGADAQAFQALLETCGRARFAPDAAPMELVCERWTEAQRLVRAFRSVS